jgi:hypothetical protein
MRYAILIYGSEEMEDADEAVLAEYGELGARPVVFGGEELDHPATATTVRLGGGDVLTTDGPYAETKEAFGGFYLIDVPNLDDAIEFASAVPAVRRGGAVEIRPLMARD